MADDQVPGLIYGNQGGDTLTFQSGAALTLESGASADFESGASLKLAGTAITATAGEVNALAGALAGATMVVANANPSTVTIQLEDAAGAALAARASLAWYLADDANGDTPTASAPAGGVAIGTDGALIEWTANAAGLMISEADGDVDITVTHAAGGVTWYLILVMPNGSLVASGAITPTA